MKAIVPALKAQSDTFAKVDRAARLMVLYPFFYIVLTLPLSAGRMWSMAHHGQELPDAYQCVAGALIASSGFVDALLYTLTRKTLLTGGASRPLMSDRKPGDGKESTGRSGNAHISLSDYGQGGITQTRTVMVTDQVINISGEDEEEEIRGRKTSKSAPYHNFERTGHSPTGSLDPIIGNITTTTQDKGHEKSVKYATDVHVLALDDASDEDETSNSSNLGRDTPQGRGNTF